MNRENPTISILVPCYNEGKTLRRCLWSWLNQTCPADEIIVVNDCSTDDTAQILDEFKDKITVINLPKNTGNKSFVQEEGLRRVKTDVFIATDADTVMDKFFVERVYMAFRDETVSAFAGYVRSLKGNWLTACREIDYLIGQDLHKSAQNRIGFLLVIPGCAGAFCTETFKKCISFDHDTLTEDLDFTYKINKNGLKVVYDKQAVVYTQDPAGLKNYVNQMRRWYGGGWQNLKKHLGSLRKFSGALELAIIYSEGLLFSALIFLLPLISPGVFLKTFLAYCLFGISLGLYCAIKRKRWDLLVYSIFYAPISYLHAYIFLEQFFREILLGKKNLIWFHPERRVIA